MTGTKDMVNSDGLVNISKCSCKVVKKVNSIPKDDFE